MPTESRAFTVMGANNPAGQPTVDVSTFAHNDSRRETTLTNVTGDFYVGVYSHEN